MAIKPYLSITSYYLLQKCPVPDGRIRKAELLVAIYIEVAVMP